MSQITASSNMQNGLLRCKGESSSTSMQVISRMKVIKARSAVYFHTLCAHSVCSCSVTNSSPLNKCSETKLLSVPCCMCHTAAAVRCSLFRGGASLRQVLPIIQSLVHEAGQTNSLQVRMSKTLFFVNTHASECKNLTVLHSWR